ncbi:MAG: DegV family protein [Anaerolineaceae bacterium]|jgi:DegV family protein with EDD domain|nr:MAG: DegV family protein [Anaerolineaceae bacterium]
MQESSIAVVTGSPAQISAAQAKNNDIEVIPFTIQLNGKVFSDGVDIEPSEVYKTMRATGEMPTTAPPSIGVFYQKFKDLFDREYRNIIYLSLSKKLSSDYAAALSMAEMLNSKYSDRKVHVVDSALVASPQGFLAMGAADQVKRGKSVNDVLHWLERASQRAGLVGSLESLDFLAKGGRIGKASHLLGSILDIIPILSVKEGEVVPLAIRRGSKGLYATILKIVQEIIKGYQKLRIAVMHTDAPEKAAALKDLTQATLSGEEIPVYDMTPLLGIHVGPGAFGLGYLFE